MNVQYQYSMRAGYPHLRVFRRRWLLPDVVYAKGLLLGQWLLNGLYPYVFSLIAHWHEYRLEIRLVGRRYDQYIDSGYDQTLRWQPLRASEGGIYAVDFKNEGWVAEWIERYGLIETLEVGLQPDGHSGRLLVTLLSQTTQAHGRSTRGLFNADDFPRVEHHHKLKRI